MPISSNYQVSISPLTREELGVIPQQPTQHHDSSLGTIFSWVATAAELLITVLLPETAPIWLGAGIGLVGAGVQTALMAEEGELSGVGLGLIWASSVIPLFPAARGTIKLNQASKELVEATKSSILSQREITKIIQTTSEVKKEKVILDKLNTLFNKQTSLEKGIEAIKLEREISKLSDVTYKLVDKGVLNASEIKNIQAILNPKTLSQASKDTFKEVLNYSLRRKGEAGAAELAEQIENDVFKGRREAIERVLNETFGEEKVKMMFGSISRLDKKAQNSAILAFIRENLSSAAAARRMLKSIRKYLNPLAREMKAAEQVKQLSSLRKFVKITSRESFNQRVVQRIQAIFDPNDLGRAPIEASYKFLRKKFAKRFAKTSKALDKFENLEEAFIKSGGKKVAGTEILGYKVISPVPPPGKSLVMIAFNPAKWDVGGTAAKNPVWNGRITKNFNGKKPVMVWATLLELEQLTTTGMSYYLDKWAYSRGGAVLGTNVFSKFLPASAMAILPFIKTSFLRNILSLTSNIVENTYSMATGQWHRTWVEKATRSFLRTGMSRLGRLAAQGIVRPAIGGRVGNFVGRELQRLLGATTTAFGNHIIDPIINGGHGREFGSAWWASYKTKAMGGGLSYLNKAGRKKNSFASQKRNAARKLGFARRPVSAVTPNDIFNPRSFGRFNI